MIWVLFLGTDTISKIETWLDKKKHKAEVLFFNNKTTAGHISLLLFLIIFLFIPSTINKETGNERIYLMMRTAVASRIDPNHFRKEFKNKIYELFKPVKTVNDHNYLLFNNIILKTKTNRHDYCIYIDGNSLINRYDYYTRNNRGRLRLLYGNIAVSAYLGLPIINSVFVKDDIFYRGDMLRVGRYCEFAGYSLPPIVCGKRVTRENMLEAAKKIGKKKIIILGNNSYEIINVK